MDAATPSIPNRRSDFVFACKVKAHQVLRLYRDVRDGIRRHYSSSSAAYPHAWATCRVPLWVEKSENEHQLELGKVQNLRRACARIDGALIPAGQVFSFWKQMGRATERRGFTAGRLLREGCLMPAVGGGLCALSNALYEAAMEAGLEIVERHAHSRKIPGSRAAITGLDATVAWNYVDLRFRCDREFQIRARLTQNELVIELRGREPREEVAPQAATPLIQIGFGPRSIDIGAHSCGSCNQTNCRHNYVDTPLHRPRTAWLLDENWPEFQRFLAETWTAEDRILLPMDGQSWKQARYRWALPEGAIVGDTALLALMRSARCRRASAGGRRTLANLEATRAVARALARRLTPEVNRLVVSQSLLPFLMENGDLGGREIIILATRLPFAELHARLEAANRHYGDVESLRDFRASDLWVETEAWAWDMARQIVTPHAEVAKLAGIKAKRLEWTLPDAARTTFNSAASAIYYPGPAMARRGAFEVREAALKLGLTVYLDSMLSEGNGLWDGVPHQILETGQKLPDGMLAAVGPCWIEGRPQGLLRAHAAGIPVVAAPACGLGERTDVMVCGLGMRTRCGTHLWDCVCRLRSQRFGSW